MGKRLKLWLWMVLMFAVGIIVWKPDEVKAANPVEEYFMPNVHFKRYDITGDQKPDDILIQAIGQNGAVYINNKNCYSFKIGSSHRLLSSLYTIKSGVPFLYLYSPNANYRGTVCGLFQYKSGKLVQVANLQGLLKNGYESYGEVTKVNGNTIITYIHFKSYTLGLSNYRFDFIYKNGTLKQKNSTGIVTEIFYNGEIQDKLTVNKTLTAYSKVTGKKKVFTLQKNDKVKINKIYRGIHGEWIRVKFGKKYGWVKCANYAQIGEPKMFSNITYAS